MILVPVRDMICSKPISVSLLEGQRCLAFLLTYRGKNPQCNPSQGSSTVVASISAELVQHQYTQFRNLLFKLFRPLCPLSTHSQSQAPHRARFAMAVSGRAMAEQTSQSGIVKQLAMLLEDPEGN
jgi:hypothetical protein